jgi:hypothetical protein
MNYTIFLIISFSSYLSCFAGFQKQSDSTTVLSGSPFAAPSSQISNTKTTDGYSELLNAGLTTLSNYGLIKSFFFMKQRFPAITPGISMITFMQLALVGFFDCKFALLMQEQFPHWGKRAYFALSLPTILALFLALPRKQSKAYLSSGVSTSSFV